MKLAGRVTWVTGGGSGYGMDADWRHGMYQGTLVVQGLDLEQTEVGVIGQYGVVDHVARFE